MTSEQSGGPFTFNGVDGASGRYITPSLTEHDVADFFPAERIQLLSVRVDEESKAQLPVQSARLGKDVPHVGQGEDILPEAASIGGDVLGELAELVDRDAKPLQLASHVGVTARKHQAEIDGLTVGPALQTNFEIRVFRHGLTGERLVVRPEQI